MPAGLTLDGPVGPRHVVKPGVVDMARTGLALNVIGMIVIVTDGLSAMPVAQSTISCPHLSRDVNRSPKP